jgi:hypothetical protein
MSTNGPMDKVSRPLVGLLLATVGLAGAWVVMLRPHNAASTKLPAPPPTHSAVTKQPAPAAPAAGSAGKSQPTPAAGPLAQALTEGKAVVLLFYGNGADDAVARRVVRAAAGRRVVTRSAPITQLGRFADITRDLDITGAPTILVVGPDRTATEIVGLPDLQQVRAALRTELSTRQPAPASTKP